MLPCDAKSRAGSKGKGPLTGTVPASKDKNFAEKEPSARWKKCNRPEHNHSKIATDIFKEWFYANLDHPFPSDEVKADFADRTVDVYFCCAVMAPLQSTFGCNLICPRRIRCQDLALLRWPRGS